MVNRALEKRHRAVIESSLAYSAEAGSTAVDGSLISRWAADRGLALLLKPARMTLTTWSVVLVALLVLDLIFLTLSLLR
jgi:hypothetical protein